MTSGFGLCGFVLPLLGGWVYEEAHRQGMPLPFRVVDRCRSQIAPLKNGLVNRCDGGGQGRLLRPDRALRDPLSNRVRRGCRSSWSGCAA